MTSKIISISENMDVELIFNVDMSEIIDFDVTSSTHDIHWAWNKAELFRAESENGEETAEVYPLDIFYKGDEVSGFVYRDTNQFFGIHEVVDSWDGGTCDKLITEFSPMAAYQATGKHTVKPVPNQ